MEVFDPDTGEIQFYVRRPYERVRQRFDVGDEPSMTIQSVAYESDINRIVERFKRDGILPPQNGAPQFEDVSQLNEDLTVLINKAGNTMEVAADNDSKLEAKRAKAEAEKAAAKRAKAEAEKAAAVPPVVPPVDLPAEGGT